MLWLLKPFVTKGIYLLFKVKMQISIKQIKRKLYPTKLLTRSVYILITLLAFNLIVLTTLLYTNHWDKVRYKLVVGTFNDFHYIAENINTTANIEEAKNLLKQAKYFDLAIRFVPYETVERQSKFVSNKITNTLNKLLSQRYSKVNYQVTMVKKKPYRLKDYISPSYNVYIYYHSNLGWIETRFSSSLVTSSSVALLSFVMVLLSILLTLIATIAINKQLMPLKQLARESRRFGRGEQVNDLVIRGASEIRVASMSFNRMKNDIKSYIRQKNLLLGAISHDLKTPITKIKLMLSLEDNVKVKNELNAQLNLMEDIITSYLALLSEEMKSNLNSSVNIYNLLQDIVLSAQTTLNKTPKIELKIDKDTLIKGHSPSLTRAFYNLIGNAYNYAKNCKVIAQYNEYGNKVLIHIDDDGKGIQNKNIQYIFEPFFKEESARTQGNIYSGSGLGLAIVKEIIKKHNGKVYYSKRSSLKGARFTISLPILKT